MMSCFLEKFVLAVLAVYLLVGVSSATSILLPHGGEKSLLHVDCRDGMRKIIGRKGGSFGCPSDIIVSRNTVPIRSLRTIVTTSPPSPTRNAPKSQAGTAPPPLII